MLTFLMALYFSKNMRSKMIWFMVMLVLQIFGYVSMARGPHHPNSEVVEKHVHYRPTKRDAHKITQDEQLLHDKEHIQEHVKVDLSKLTDEELEFRFFQSHDTDNNDKLDGLEMLQAIFHTHHQDDDDQDFGAGAGAVDSNYLEEAEKTRKEQLEEDLRYVTELIDQVLNEDDIDKDGFISYSEYVAGKQKNPRYEGLTSFKKSE